MSAENSVTDSIGDVYSTDQEVAAEVLDTYHGVLRYEDVSP